MNPLVVPGLFTVEGVELKCQLLFCRLEFLGTRLFHEVPLQSVISNLGMIDIVTN